MEFSSLGGHSEDCIGLPRATPVHVWRWYVLLVRRMSRRLHWLASNNLRKLVWSEAILKTALARFEQPLRCSFCRNRNKFIRRCSSWSRIGKSSSNNNDGHSRSLWRKEAERPLRRLHWLASQGLYPAGQMVQRRLRMEIGILEIQRI